MDASLPLRISKKRTPSLYGCMMRGVLGALLAMLLLSLAATLFAYRSDDPGTHMRALSYGITLLTFFTGGLLTGKRRGRQGLLCGAITGLSLLLLCTIAYLLLTGDHEIDLGRLLVSDGIWLATSLLGGAVGGAAPKKSLHRTRRATRR